MVFDISGLDVRLLLNLLLQFQCFIFLNFSHRVPLKKQHLLLCTHWYVRVIWKQVKLMFVLGWVYSEKVNKKKTTLKESKPNLTTTAKRQPTPMNRSRHFNLQQNNFKFISFCFTWIPYNKNTAEFWRVLDIFFLWLIIIINTNMNTSYTINTALSKGVESTTRHHSPLTTEYISFQHIYKSYSEREKETEVGGVGGGTRRKREKARCF